MRPLQLFKLFGTIAVDNYEAKNNIDETTGKAQESQSKIVDAFKKVGTAVVTYFAVDKIVNFGKACLDAAADASATASQFTQVFGELESQAAGNLSNIADSAGIAENRMKASYTKIAAFAKTTGMETADALSLADRAMIAVADSAAFYDRTLEETTESLQSFLKGNFENDAALGLSCTEITRNAAATKLFGQEYKNLTEQQKQLTLLQMVEDANELSGAMGQAARESNTWTNQIGNLQQAWTDFKSAIGGYFLEDAITGVSKATEALRWLQDVATDLCELWGEVLAPAVRTVGEAFGNIWTALEPARQAFANLLPESMTAASGMDIIRQACWFLEDMLLAVADRLNTVSAWISTNAPFITQTITALWEGMQYLWETIGQPVFDMLMVCIENVKYAFELYMPLIEQFVSKCFSDIQTFWNVNLKPCLEAIGNFIKTVLAPVFQSVFDGTILPLVSTVFKSIKNLWETVLKPVFTGITDFLTGVFTLNWQQAFEGLVSIVKGVVNGIINGIETMVNGAISALNGLIDGLNKVVSIAGKLLGLNVKIPNIPLLNLPRLEEGGILERGQVGLLEGNGAEAVVPLDQNRKWISAVADDMNSAMGGGQQMQRLIDLMEMLIDMLPDTMKDAFASMKFDVNNREFARLVKAVN